MNLTRLTLVVIGLLLAACAPTITDAVPDLATEAATLLEATTEATSEATTEATTEAPFVDGELGENVGVIVLAPFSGAPDSTVQVVGEAWPPNSPIIISMRLGGLPYAVAAATSDASGNFQTSFIVPTNPEFEERNALPIEAYVQGEQARANALFVVSGTARATATAAPTGASDEVDSAETATPTADSEAEMSDTLRPTATPRATATSAPPVAMVAVNTLNVRSGPGVIYRRVGQVEADQELRIIGRNGTWWRVSFPNAVSDEGWISGFYVLTRNTGDVPFIAAPPTPFIQPTATPSPTATPQPQVCSPGEWSGCGGRPPALICPDDHVSQCTSNGQWGQCLWDPGFCWDDDSEDDDDNDDDDNDDDDNDDDN